MRSSSVDAAVAIEGLATGYVRGTRVAHIERMPRLYREWNPAGNLVTSAVDAGRYLVFQLGDGHADCGGQVLSTAAMNEMHRGQVPGEGVLEAIGVQGMRYAFGWETNDFEGLQLISHGGDMDSHAAFFLFIPRAGIGVALLMNTLDYGKLQVPINVARLLLGIEVSPYQGASPVTAVPAGSFKGDPALWQSLVGRYDTSDGPMRVFMAEGTLHAEVMAGKGLGEVLRLEPFAPAEFIARSDLLRWEGRKLLFKVGSAGVCASLDGENYGSRVDSARTTDACR
jgi:CubicO group peptidase (beta-lactamase class C family)